MMLCSIITPSSGSRSKAKSKNGFQRSEPKCSNAPIDTMRSTGSVNCSQPANSTRRLRSDGVSAKARSA